MNYAFLTWANQQRADWRLSLKNLRSGQSGTFELRRQKRTDTTVETIADLSRRLSDLDAMIAQGGVSEDVGRRKVG
jgi:hypothetical protein